RTASGPASPRARTPPPRYADAAARIHGFAMVSRKRSDPWRADAVGDVRGSGRLFGVRLTTSIRAGSDVAAVSGRSTDLGAREPGRDRAVSPMVDRVSTLSTVTQRSMPYDEISVLEHAKLARDRRSAQPKLASEIRRATEPEREQRNELEAR